MTEPTIERDETRLRALVRDGLSGRDRAARMPAFVRMWPEDSGAPRFGAPWRMALTSVASLAVAAIVLWAVPRVRNEHPQAAADSGPMLKLAHELSSPGYWRVPTDDLLAFSAPPLSAALPSPDVPYVSAEESVL